MLACRQPAPYTKVMEQVATVLMLTQLLEHYAPSPAAIELVQQTPILLLVGISGAGKDTIRRELAQSKKYHSIVSHTTRAPRSNGGILEQDGVDYHFIHHDEALIMVEQGAFVEAKLYAGNVYGTSVSELAAAKSEKRIAIADIEVQGVAEYKALSSSVLAVFLLPPSYDVWIERLRSRYGDTTIDQTDLTHRMETAIIELQHALETDYFVFVVNDVLEDTVRTIDAIARDPRGVALDDTGAKAVARELLHHVRAAM
jgi:guanylate kinase